MHHINSHVSSNNELNDDEPLELVEEESNDEDDLEPEDEEASDDEDDDPGNADDGP